MLLKGVSRLLAYTTLFSEKSAQACKWGGAEEHAPFAGMNLDPLPISETQLAFWLVIGVGTGISVAMFVLIFSYAR